MQRILTLVLLSGLAVGTVAAQQKQRLGDIMKPVDPAAYTLTVHVTHASLLGPLNTLHLDVIVGGKKVTLESQEGLELLHIGDYKARLVKDEEKSGGFFASSYELLFADGMHRFFNVVAEFE